MESGDDPNTGKPITSVIVYGDCTLYTVYLIFKPSVVFNYRTMMWVSTVRSKRRTYRLCAGKLPKLESESEEEEYSRETPDFPDDIPKSGGGGGGEGTEQPKPSSPGFSKVEAEPLWGLDPKHDGSSFDNDIDSRFHPSRFDGPSGLDKQMEGTATGPRKES